MKNEFKESIMYEEEINKLQSSIKKLGLENSYSKKLSKLADIDTKFSKLQRKLVGFDRANDYWNNSSKLIDTQTKLNKLQWDESKFALPKEYNYNFRHIAYLETNFGLLQKNMIKTGLANDISLNFKNIVNFDSDFSRLLMGLDKFRVPNSYSNILGKMANIDELTSKFHKESIGFTAINSLLYDFKNIDFIGNEKSGFSLDKYNIVLSELGLFSDEFDEFVEDVEEIGLEFEEDKDYLAYILKLKKIVIDNRSDIFTIISIILTLLSMFGSNSNSGNISTTNISTTNNTNINININNVNIINNNKNITIDASAKSEILRLFFIVISLVNTAVFVAKNNATIKEGKSSKSKKTSNIKKGEVVSIIDVNNPYYKIEYFDKEQNKIVTGFVAKHDIKSTKD